MEEEKDSGDALAQIPEGMRAMFKKMMDDQV